MDIISKLDQIEGAAEDEKEDGQANKVHRTGTDLKDDAESRKTLSRMRSNIYEVPLGQIMDEIYDEYLVDLPDTLPETMKKAQEVKEEMYRKYIQRIVEIK